METSTLYKIRTKLNLRKGRMAYLLGINHITYGAREKRTDLHLLDALTARQYLKLKQLCSDSTYCTQLIVDAESEVVTQMQDEQDN